MARALGYIQTLSIARLKVLTLSRLISACSGLVSLAVWRMEGDTVVVEHISIPTLSKLHFPRSPTSFSKPIFRFVTHLDISVDYPGWPSLRKAGLDKMDGVTHLAMNALAAPVPLTVIVENLLDIIPPRLQVLVLGIDSYQSRESTFSRLANGDDDVRVVPYFSGHSGHIVPKPGLILDYSAREKLKSWTGQLSEDESFWGLGLQIVQDRQRRRSRIWLVMLFFVLRQLPQSNGQRGTNNSVSVQSRQWLQSIYSTTQWSELLV